MPPLRRVFHSLFAVIVFCASATVLSGQSPSSKAPLQDDFVRGSSLLHEGKIDQAIEALLVATRVEPDNADAWYSLAMAYQAGGHEEQTHSAYGKAIALRPFHLRFRINQAYFALITNDLTRAEFLAAEAATIDPEDAEIRFIRGTARLRKRNFTGALEDAKAAVAALPAFAEAMRLKYEAELNAYLAGYKAIDPVPFAQRKPFLEAAIATLEGYSRLELKASDKEYAQHQLPILRALLIDEVRIYGGEPDRAFRQNAVDTKAVVLSRPSPIYTEEAKLRHEAGVVRFVAIVETDGRLSQLLVIRSLSTGLTLSAIKAAQQMLFSPAVFRRRPVPQRVAIDYYFGIL